MRIDRRGFLKSTAAATAGGVILPVTGRTEASRAVIYVVHGTAPEAMLTAGIAKLGGFGAFVKKGGKVTIKPNAAWASRPEQAGNTHPDLVLACINACRAAGAREVVLPENPCSPAKQAFSQSGIQAAATKGGARLYALSEKDHFRKVAIPAGKTLKEADVATDVLDTDCLINMPVVKSHGSAVITVAMKNWMGSVQDRKSWHSSALDQCIADINTRIRPNLVIADATRIMVTEGPRGPGKIEKPQQIVLGTDQVAVDAYAATLFGKKPFDIPHIRIAHEMRIGCGDLDKIDIQRLRV